MRTIICLILIAFQVSALAQHQRLRGGVRLRQWQRASAVLQQQQPQTPGPETTITNSLVSYWAMDEASNGTATTSRADSIGGQTLTDNGVSSATTGILGNAVLVNETSTAEAESLSHTDSATLSMGNAGFTITGWFKCLTFITNITIVSKFDWGSTGQEFALRVPISDGHPQFRATPDGTSTAMQAVSAADWTLNAATTNQWAFFACWHDPANNVLGIQVNGGTVYTVNYPTDAVFDSTKTFYVGRTANTGASLIEYWRGAIDELGLWKRALTTNEIAYLYNSGSGRNPLTP